MFRAAVLAVLMICMSLVTAQEITRKPEPIQFEDWKLVGDSDSNLEYEIKFPSAFSTDFPENNTVELRVLTPKASTSPIPIVMLLHYWGARDLKVERSLAGELNRRGIAAAILVLPYHLSRTPHGYESGEMAVQPDPKALISNSIQSVWDVRRALDFLQTKAQFDRYGIAGTSLGAVVAELSYGIDERFNRAAFILGGADLAHLIWNSSRIVRQRDALRRRGYTESRLRTELESIEPSTFLRAKTEGDALIVAARYDTVIPERSTLVLQNSMPNAQKLIVDTGHYGGLFVQKRILREVATYFAKKYSGEEYKAPTKIFAPTVRIGATAATSNGFNLAAGLDLFKLDNRGDTFGSILMTTRGPQLFFGRKIDSRISFGVVGSRTKVGLGLFWSTVL